MKSGSVSASRQFTCGRVSEAIIRTVDLDSLGLQIIVQTLKSTFATISGLLDAAKWGVWCWEVPVVDGDCARFHQACN